MLANNELGKKNCTDHMASMDLILKQCLKIFIKIKKIL